MHPLLRQWAEVQRQLRLNKIYQGLRVSNDRPRYVFNGKSRDYYRCFHPDKKIKSIFIPGLGMRFYRPIFGASPGTYYMREDGTAANKAAASGPGSTQANCMNVSVHNGETFAAADIIKLCDDGGNYTSQIVPPSSGSSGSPIAYDPESGDTPVCDGSLDVTGASYDWYASGSGSNEWYLQASGGGDPSISDPNVVLIDGVNLGAEGTMGSLADHKWDWGDNDTLGYSTLYVRDDTGDPDTSGATILAGSVSNGFGISAKDYITVDGITMRYFRHRGLYTTDSDYLVLQNCTIQHTGLHCVEAEITCNYLDLNNNDISYSRSNGIWLDDVEYADVYQNVVSYCEANGIGLTNYSQYNEVYRNWCHHNSIGGDTAGVGLEVHTYYNKVYYNLLTQNAHAGVVLNAENNEVYNNTTYDNTHADTVWGSEINLIDWTSSAENNTLKNNILIAKGSDGRTVYAAGVGERNNTFDYNLHFHPDKAANYEIIQFGGDDESFSDWQTDYSQDLNGQLADPNFVTEYTDFRLQRDSPCLRVGVDVGLTEDYAGNPVPQGYYPDIGAYEYMVAVIRRGRGLSEFGQAFSPLMISGGTPAAEGQPYVIRGQGVPTMQGYRDRIGKWNVLVLPLLVYEALRQLIEGLRGG